MSISVPASLEAITDEMLAIDASYFVVRVLRNLGRGFGKASVSREPSAEARELAVRALQEIENSEGVAVVALGRDRISAYIAVLEDFQDSRARGADADRAGAILEEMRQSDKVN